MAKRIVATDHVTTDHSVLNTGRAQLAAAAAWEITTLCDELLEHAARIAAPKPPQPHHSAIIVKLLASRAHELAEAAALCLTEDEASQPLAELERTVTHG